MITVSGTVIEVHGKFYRVKLFLQSEFRSRPRGSRADRTYDEQIVVACGEKLAYGYRRVAWWLRTKSPAGNL